MASDRCKSVEKMKRGLQASSSEPAKRKKVKHESYKKWVREYDRECQTVMWLECENGGRYETCDKAQMSSMHQVQGQDYNWKNFSDKWISGADSVRTTNVLDHVKSNQIVHAMNLLRKQQAQAQGMSVATYSPIAQSLTHTD